MPEDAYRYFLKNIVINFVTQKIIALPRASVKCAQVENV